MEFTQHLDAKSKIHEYFRLNMVHFNDFVDEVQKLGVENALYMDMGSGWNYSWLRDASGKVLELFGLPVPWSHNWIIF